MKALENYNPEEKKSGSWYIYKKTKKITEQVSNPKIMLQDIARKTALIIV